MREGVQDKQDRRMRRRKKEAREYMAGNVIDVGYVRNKYSHLIKKIALDLLTRS